MRAVDLLEKACLVNAAIMKKNPGVELKHN